MKTLKKIKISVLLLSIFTIPITIEAQLYRKVQNQPAADQKLFHLGFFVGFHTQDMVMKNTGTPTSTGEVWFADVPSYSPGFSVGIIGDRYINQYFNLRVSPSLHFGEKKFTYREQKTGEKYNTTQRGDFLTFPIHLKFNGGRMHNMRPYFLAGAYTSLGLGLKKGEAIRFERIDYGLDFGVGCNIYLPLFKLCPELRFSLGLKDLINKNNSDVSEPDILKYRYAVSSGKTRMISLIFNFE